MKKIFAVFLCFFSIFLFSDAYAGNKNVTIDSFNKAKKLLEREVYFDHRVTIYCNALFDEEKNITIPKGFVAPTHKKDRNVLNGNILSLLRTLGVHF